jgi:hypothetical protein
VHGDDGRRYTNDSYGGRDFVQPFRNGDTVGIGMRWEKAQLTGAGDQKTTQAHQAPPKVWVWFTRNGKEEGGWWLDEQRDAEEENDPLPGLDGCCDVYAAIGVWGGGVQAQAKFLTQSLM